MKYYLTTLLLLISLATIAQDDIVVKANAFIGQLDANQKTKALFSFDSPERFNWHFVPKERLGISFHALTKPQREAAYQLLKTSLSNEGYTKATSIVALEDVLRHVENRGPNDTYRDPENYYFSIFGTPDKKNPWAWRFEGHHISVNFAFSNGQIQSSTPTFWGSNPAIVKDGPKKGTQVLKKEMDLAFSLINSLSTQQIEIAKIANNALPEILSFNSLKAESLTPVGISYRNLNPAQQNIFMQLLETYINNYELGFSKTLMNKIKKAGIENLSFGYAGSTAPDGGGQYYRIQGAMLLIEYDNTQNRGNHVHTAVRDLTNDFAEDILREHYQKEHQK